MSRIIVQIPNTANPTITRNLEFSIEREQLQGKSVNITNIINQNNNIIYFIDTEESADYTFTLNRKIENQIRGIGKTNLDVNYTETEVNEELIRHDNAIQKMRLRDEKSSPSERLKREKNRLRGHIFRLQDNKARAKRIFRMTGEEQHKNEMEKIEKNIERLEKRRSELTLNGIESKTNVNLSDDDINSLLN